MIKHTARRTAYLSYLIIGILLIVLALFTVAARLGLPLLSSQKGNIESLVSDYLESPVEIGALSLRWEGLGPLLYATDVSVQQTSERKVALRELLIDINLPKTLLRGIPIINELSLIGASLVIEADAAGQISVNGMEQIKRRPDAADVIAPGSNSNGIDVIAWLFNAKKVGLLQTRLTLRDLFNDRQLVLDDLNIRSENIGKVHQLRIDAQLPAAYGGRVEAGIDLRGTSDLANSSGNIYLAADAMQVSALTTLMRATGLLDSDDAGPFGFDAQASVEMWGEWQDGQLVSARGPLVFEQVVEPATGDVLFDKVAAQVGVLLSDEATKVSVTNVRASSGEHVLEVEEVLVREHRARQGLDSTSTADNDAPDWQISAQASELPADLMVRLMRLAPVEQHTALTSSLQSLAADGFVRNLSLNTQVSTSDTLLDFSANFDNIEIRGDGTLPSIGPLSGEMSIVDSVGQISANGQQMRVAWPAASSQEVSLDSLSAVIDIDVRSAQRVVLDANVQLADDGIDTATRARVTLLSDQSPHLDIQSRFDVADLRALKTWIPDKLLSPKATNWFDSAIKSGAATDGTLLFFGQVADFPFANEEGVFQATVDIADTELAFLPEWPSAQGIDGRLELDGLSLNVVAQESTLASFNLSDSRVTISDLTAPVLEFGATANGQLQDLLEFGSNGPLANILRPAIGEMRGTGGAQMDLQLAVPLFAKPPETGNERLVSAWKPLQLDGSVFLNRNDVTFGRAGIRLDAATGAVGFNERGISIDNLRGRLLGHSVQVNGKTVGRGSAADTTVTISGAIEANDLLVHFKNPLDQFITGASQWTASISAPHSAQRMNSEGVSLVVSSDLVGAELLLPAPFGKGSARFAPFTLKTAFRQNAPEQVWEAQYSDELAAHVKLRNRRLYSMLLELGQQRFDDVDAALEVQGIRMQGNVPTLALQSWIGTINRYIKSLSGGGGAPQPILPISASVTTEALILGNQSIGKASLNANTDDTYLNVALSNKALAGSARYPREHWKKDTPLKARIKTFDWSVIEALTSGEPSTGNARSAALDPRLLPPVEARIAELIIGDVRVRDLVVRAQPNVSGLDVTTVGFAYDTMRLVGKGYWHLRDPQNVSARLSGKQQSALNLVLQSDDFGKGLDQIGLSDIIDDAQGSVVMNLSWPGPLYMPAIASLNGDVAINMEAGSIVPFEPGAGRMMGLFAIQALPRRLNLDFRDLTGEGIAFSTITGTAVIEKGVAQVPLLQVKGPIGVVDIVGQSDLNTRQFDQRVTVLPRVSAALPIIGALSGGATAGVGALIAAGFLKAIGVDFDRIGLRSYSLKGAWTEPEFTPISSDFWRQRE